ncbi:hypothetical protein MMPV_007892 [Pyropia vietnamensis]
MDERMGSLNQLLQWSVTQSTAGGAAAADGGRSTAAADTPPAAARAADGGGGGTGGGGTGGKALAIGPPPPPGSAPRPTADETRTRPAFDPRDPANAAWLDAFVPDTFAEVRALGAAVADPSSTAADRVTALESLEEYASDLDYAENFHKPTVNVLDTVISAAAADPDAAVRAMAVWVLGTAMADSPTVKAEVLKRGGVALLVDRLADPDLQVVAKAAGAATGLVRHGAGGKDAAAALGPGLLGVLARGPKPSDAGDGDGGGDGGWMRVLFFLRHAGAMSAPWFPAAAATAPEVVTALAAALADGGTDGEDPAAVEAVLAGAAAAAAAAPEVAAAGGGGVGGGGGRCRPRCCARRGWRGAGGGGGAQQTIAGGVGERGRLYASSGKGGGAGGESSQHLRRVGVAPRSFIYADPY